MKKLLILTLALLLLVLPVTVSATAQGSGTTGQDGYMLASTLVNDYENLLDSDERAYLEAMYHGFAEEYGFTPILYTVPSFQGRSADQAAAWYYDTQGYPYDGILLLVSLTEGEYYILTNGGCYANISNREAQEIGDWLVSYLRDGSYFEAFAIFPELANDAMQGGESSYGGEKNYPKTIAISMVVGLVIGGIVAGVMAMQMKSVRAQSGADSYLRSGSMRMYNSRDIYLYSHVTRTPKPKSNSSGGSGGGSRGGAGGRI